MKNIEWVIEAEEALEALRAEREAVALAGGPEAHRRKQARKRRVEQARARAQAWGLAYWPALIRPRVDVKAYLVAEKILEGRHGRYNPPETWGGWDWYGHHGLSPRQVEQMWWASGCKDSPKFHWQVSNRLVAKKGDTLPWLKAYRRGLDWLIRWGQPTYLYSRKAVAALGRLSFEARFWAILGAKERAQAEKGEGQAPVRIRHLNWKGVRQLEQLRKDPSRRALLIRALLLPKGPAARLLGLPPSKEHPIGEREIAEILPAFPKVSLEIARLIVAGVPPVEIAMGHLSKKEAHAWLQDGGPRSASWSDIMESVSAWLARHLPLEGFVPRRPEVSRWLLDVYRRGAWEALTRERRHGNGQVHRLINHIDMIEPGDLVHGPRTGVELAFERASLRAGRLDPSDERPLAPNPFPYVPKWMRVLNTPASLVREGKEMEHCVASFAPMVARQECVIVSISSRHGRSTAELRLSGGKWTVAQHRSFANGPAPARHARLLTAWLNRLNRLNGNGG